MPKEFNDCVKAGGKIFTVEAGKHHYVHGCQLPGKKAVYGERKKKKDNQQKNK